MAGAQLSRVTGNSTDAMLLIEEGRASLRAHRERIVSWRRRRS